MRVFFSPSDFHTYKTLLAARARRYALDVWAYCLMPNHVHLVAVPSSEHGLSRPLGEAHQRYALYVNRKQGWRGHLWQERFASFPMDEAHLRAAVRYVLLNPVRAGLARQAVDWPFSSARAHVLGSSDHLVNSEPMLARISDWDLYLSSLAGAYDQPEQDLRRHGRIGRPLGCPEFVEKLEKITGRRLQPRKVGRKPAQRA